jgi:hypothetical protein
MCTQKHLIDQIISVSAFFHPCSLSIENVKDFISYIFVFWPRSVGILTPNVIEAYSMQQKKSHCKTVQPCNLCGYSTEKIL